MVAAMSVWRFFWSHPFRVLPGPSAHGSTSHSVPAPPRTRITPTPLENMDGRHPWELIEVGLAGRLSKGRGGRGQAGFRAGRESVGSQPGTSGNALKLG